MTIPSLRSFISSVSELKRAKYSFSASRHPYWKFTRATDVFLGTLLVAKWVQNALANCLKLSINWVGNVVNQHRPAFLRVVEKALHMIGSNALDRSIDARNDSRWSCRSFVPL